MVAARDAKQARDLHDQYGLFVHVIWWLLSSLKPATPPAAGSAEAKAWKTYQAQEQTRLNSEVRPPCSPACLHACMQAPMHAVAERTSQCLLAARVQCACAGHAQDWTASCCS